MPTILENYPEQVLAEKLATAIDAGKNNKGITMLEFHKLRIEGMPKSTS